jgi:hypothetical protein
MTDSHERFDELAAGYALHALEPDDEQVFRTHLAGCSVCERALAVHTDTLGHLAYAAAPAELPAGILAGVRREIGVAEQPELAAPVRLDAVRARRARLMSNQALVGIAAAAILVLSLGVWNVSLHRDRSQADQRSQQLVAAVRALEGDAKQRVELTDSQGLPVAIAVVRADDTVSLVVDGLSPNDRAASTYVLWQKGRYGVVRAVGTFDVQGKGVNVVKNLPLASDVVGVEGFAVTKEPGRSAPAAPGSKPVADGSQSA